MARWITAALIASVFATSAVPARADNQAAKAWAARAERAEQALRGDESKLRLRHHIIHVIKLWQSAANRADGELKAHLLEREAEVWGLLAHWSGRSDDARRARQEREEAESFAARLTAEPRPPIPEPATETISEPAQTAERTERIDRTERAERIEGTERAERTDRPQTEHIAEPAAPAEALEAVATTEVQVPSVTAADAARYRPRDCTPSDADPLAVRTVVIDPGHGGEDEGARNRDGVWEKDVNLDIAVRVAQQLEGFCVILTRWDDTFVSLADRVRIANEARADLFISVHANGSHRADFHGVETYVLDVDTRRYQTRLRGRELELHGEAPPVGEDPHWHRDVHLLLADLAMRGATRDARRLAERVQSAVVGRLRERHPETKDLGVKSALFYVLLGARMPSVLVETGFMTNPAEGRRLARAEHQVQVAEAIADGIRAFAHDRSVRPSVGGAVVARAP